MNEDRLSCKFRNFLCARITDTWTVETSIFHFIWKVAKHTICYVSSSNIWKYLVCPRKLNKMHTFICLESFTLKCHAGFNIFYLFLLDSTEKKFQTKIVFTRYRVNVLFLSRLLSVCVLICCLITLCVCVCVCLSTVQTCNLISSNFLLL